MKDAPLDLRFDRSREHDNPTAADVVNTLAERELADLFWRYGEERFSRRIARAICRAREQQPIRTTLDLARIVERAVPGPRRRIHKATRVFQSLRIHLAKELDNVARFMEILPDIMVAGGRFVSLSYHSLEDRLLKTAIREHEKNGLLKRITRKVVRPSEVEVERNPRSRSAKLRCAEKTAA